MEGPSCQPSAVSHQENLFAARSRIHPLARVVHVRIWINPWTAKAKAQACCGVRPKESLFLMADG
jgi:hypothetical protein